MLGRQALTSLPEPASPPSSPLDSKSASCECPWRSAIWHGLRTLVFEKTAMERQQNEAQHAPLAVYVLDFIVGPSPPQ